LQGEQGKMGEVKEKRMTWKDIVPASVAGVLTVAMVVLTICLYYNEAGLDWLLYIGWAILAVGIVLIMTPAAVLRRKGGVPEGKSWVNTTVVVSGGPYALVRHPLYVGWMIIMFALILISQHWITAILGIVAMAICYPDIPKEDRSNVEKFGDEYKRYQEAVPMANPVLGVIRLLRRRTRS